jgi:hypothetical protein
MTDHNGVQFTSSGARAEAHGLSRHTVNRRLRSGMSLEEALTTPRQAGPVKVVDHEGVEYDSIVELCKAWGVNRRVYSSRLRIGWTMEEALTANSRVVKDHTGRIFESFKKMAEHWKISASILSDRLRRGRSLETALTGKSVTDHTGQQYMSETAMCRAWNVATAVYWSRRADGWDLQAALVTPSRYQTRTCPNGVQFTHLSKMVAHYGVRRSVYSARVKDLGWTVSEALEINGRGLERKILENRHGNRAVNVVSKSHVGRSTGAQWFKVELVCSGKTTYMTADQLIIEETSNDSEFRRPSRNSP